ncbi:MAG: hypothetical protein ACI8T1_003538 [Verrucomicrobiales bacterium]
MAIWNRVLTDKDVELLRNNAIPKPLGELLPDLDEDGLPDRWERRHLRRGVNDMAGDFGGEGKTSIGMG